MTGNEVIFVAVLIGLVWLMWKVTRNSLGSSDDSFMAKIVKLGILVMLVAGGLVWILDRADENTGDGGSPPGTRSGEHAPNQPARQHRQNGGDKIR